MQSLSANKKQHKTDRPDLDRRYGKIGISAVAAAVRYASTPQKPPHAPIAPRAAKLPDDVA
jgi:hypothetical protein